MKVLYFCNMIPRKLGAVERLWIMLAEQLAAAGDTMMLALAGEPIPNVAEDLAEHDVRWCVVPGWGEEHGRVRPWRFCLPAAALVRRLKPDVAVVHFGNELPSLAACLLARLGSNHRTQWIWVQDREISEPRGLRTRVSQLRLLSLCFRHIVAVYEGGRDSILRRGLPSGRVSVIRNGVSDYITTKHDGWLTESLSLPPDARILACVSSLIPRKRIDFVLRAFSRVHAGAGVPLCMLIVGNGPERGALEALAESLGVRDSVRFLGQRNDVREIVGQADALVHAASSEGSAYAITEAMCAGIPVIAANAGAAAEQVADGVSGYVTATDDTTAFEKRLEQVVKDPDHSRKLGEAARARWRDRYRLEDSAARYSELLRNCAVGGAAE